MVMVAAEDLLKNGLLYKYLERKHGFYKVKKTIISIILYSIII